MKSELKSVFNYYYLNRNDLQTLGISSIKADTRTLLSYVKNT